MLKFALIELHRQKDNSPLCKRICDELMEFIYSADPDFNFCVDLWDSCNRSDEIVRALRRDKEGNSDFNIEEVKVNLL